MSRQRTQEEWSAVIAEYKVSGLTVREFCRERRTCPSHFSKRMREMEAAQEGTSPSAFVRAVPAPKKILTKPFSPDSLSLRYKESTLLFRELPDPSWLMQLLERLR
jgi:hypothetical protein